MKAALLIAQSLTARKTILATAESCSGGLIGHVLTNIPGSSNWFRGGVIAYDNSIKTSLLNVPASLIAHHGAVSAPVAKAMAQGARQRFKTTIGLATTGIAGPGGGTKTKPVGLVFIACATPQRLVVKKCFFQGSRLSIKRQTTVTALNILKALLH